MEKISNYKQMKNLINISQKWRKLTALLLLLNFTVTPVIIAFPEEKCDAACEINLPTHECNTDAMNMEEDSCCDVIVDMNSTEKSTAPNNCEMEFSDINCAIIINDQIGTTYIIPKTIDNKVEFVQLSTIDLQNDNSNVELLDLIQELSFESNPPIYLTISSFLN